MEKPTASPRDTCQFLGLIFSCNKNSFWKAGRKRLGPHRNSQVEAHGHPPASRFRLPSLVKAVKAFSDVGYTYTIHGNHLRVYMILTPNIPNKTIQNPQIKPQFLELYVESYMLSFSGKVLSPTEHCEKLFWLVENNTWSFNLRWYPYLDSCFLL